MTLPFHLILIGVCPTFALEFCPFRGNVDFLNKTIDLVLGEKNKSSVGIKLALVSHNSYKLNLDLENIKTSVLEISTQLESSFDLVESSDKKNRLLQGQISSRYSLFNHKPVEELTGTFQVKNHTFFLSSGILGSSKINGFVELLYPYNLSFFMQLDNMPMTDFLSLWVDDPDLRAKGDVSGTIQAMGSLNRLNLQGSLFSSQGVVEELAYNSIVLNAEGGYPIVKLFDTTITQLDGISFNLDGNIDLSDRQHFLKQIQNLNKSPLVKEGNSQWEWTIKRKEKEAVSVSELKYFLQKKDSQENPLKEESEVMGVEKKIKF